MGEDRPDSLDFDWKNRRVRASGPVSVIAAVVLILLLLASVTPAYVLSRQVSQVERGVLQGFTQMAEQHARLIDLQEAAVYTFMPPDLQRRVPLPAWVRQQIEQQDIETKKEREK